jgi:hypothetical protein
MTKTALAKLFDDKAIQALSGGKTFARGKTYAVSGAVIIQAEQTESAPTVRAEVQGTSTYTTSVSIDHGKIIGDCDCPGAVDGWFCKHMVAVALVWRDRLMDTETVIDEAAQKKVQASAKRAQTVRANRSALHEFLRSRSAEELAEKLIDLANNERDIERELQQWQKLKELPNNPANLKSLITEMLAINVNAFNWRDAPDYARRMQSLLPILQQELKRDAKSALALATHALRRSWVVMMHVDDSNGYLGDIVTQIADQWLVALQRCGAQPATFGDTYLRLQLEDPFGCFDGKIAEQAMGVAALNRYRTALAAEWREAKDAELAKKAKRAAKYKSAYRFIGHRSSFDENSIRLRTLERLHLAQLEANGEVDEALAVLREDMSDAMQYSQVTEFLEKHQRTRDAFANAELAYKTFPDDWHVRDILLGYYERDGWTDEAYAMRRKNFDEHPNPENFRHLLKAGTAAGKDTAALRTELMQVLETRELEEAQSRRIANGVRDVSLRAEILCSERKWNEALGLVQPPAVCNAHTLRKIALHLGKVQHKQAVVLLERVLKFSMRTATSPYREPLQLVSEIIERLDALPRAQYLSRLRQEYKAKRNFIRDLPEQ